MLPRDDLYKMAGILLTSQSPDRVEEAISSRLDELGYPKHPQSLRDAQTFLAGHLPASYSALTRCDQIEMSEHLLAGENLDKVEELVYSRLREMDEPKTALEKVVVWFATKLGLIANHRR
jgi:hypothetical protein